MVAKFLIRQKIITFLRKLNFFFVLLWHWKLLSNIINWIFTVTFKFTVCYDGCKIRRLEKMLCRNSITILPIQQYLKMSY